MFDDWRISMKIFTPLNPPASAQRAVAPRLTYDYGIRETCHGSGLDVRNGRLFEKTQRKRIFLDQRKS